ncbi:MAG: MerR family transcriptional regulator, partial [Culicoidibacterales bacterium]
MKEKLFTIGEVAKITGVHAKSLRYYETIGILKPIKIDHQTRYRYYSQQQLDLVALIQLCIELDIPLKSLREFSCVNEQQIDVQQVFAYGKKIAEAKIAKLQRGLKYIESFEADVQQNQVLNEQISQPLHEQIKQKSYFIKQLAVFPTISEYWQMYQQMTDELTNQGVMKSYENGMLLYRQPDGRLSYYQFIEVTKGESDWPPGVLIIQPGHYPVHILAEVMLTDDIDADFLA